MIGKTKENFMSNFINEWESKYDHEPISEIVTDYYDDITTLNYEDPIDYEEIELGDRKVLNPIFSNKFNQEQMEKIHYKPVQYVEPWTEVEGDGIFTKDHLIQGTDGDIPICYWENDGSTKLQMITENEIWLEERPEVIKTIKKRVHINSRQSHAENLYETMFEEE